MCETKTTKRTLECQVSVWQEQFNIIDVVKTNDLLIIQKVLLTMEELESYRIWFNNEIKTQANSIKMSDIQKMRYLHKCNTIWYKKKLVKTGICSDLGKMNKRKCINNEKYFGAVDVLHEVLLLVWCVYRWCYWLCNWWYWLHTKDTMKGINDFSNK